MRFLGDETFLRGSALWISSPLLLAGIVGGGALLGWLLATRTPPRSRLTGGAGIALSAGAAVLLFGVHALWMLDRLPVGWRYADFVHVNASRALSTSTSAERGSATAMTDRLPELLADLDGKPIAALGQSGRNVLLIFVEGVSGGHLPDNVEAQGALAGPEMPRLQKFARRGLNYETFIAHQRRTNRGLYAGLCGELPNLLRAMPKMTAYIDGGTRTCLPHVMRDAGYRTVYLQAAPLAFMLKDQFMPKAGFDEVYGHDWFETPYVRSVWGVDDRAYFEQSLRMVDRLQREEIPWFLTLLTVGTHHPTIIPKNFESEKPIRFSRALSYADQAIYAFLVALEQRGVFENTLVLITSDESRGMSAGRDKTTAALTQNWGFLIALLPEKLQASIAEPFGLVDIPISVLDYLGLAERGEHFFGRSLFRSYASGRYLFFANRNLRIFGSRAPDGSLVLCPTSMIGCRRYAPEDGRLFSGRRTEVDWNEDYGAVTRDIAQLSVEVQERGVQPRVYELLMTPRFKVERRHPSLIHGGQHIDLKKNQWIDVEFEFDAVGGRHSVEFAHVLNMGAGKRRRFWVKARSGESVAFRYTYLASRDLRGVTCRSLARVMGLEETELTFRKARMTVHTFGARPEPGVVVQRHEVVRTSTLQRENRTSGSE